METIRGAIVSYAVDYIGQQEIKGNMGFHDKDFDKKMRDMGFINGYAWCTLFAELCWHLGYEDFDTDSHKILSSNFHAGSVRTFRAFKKLGWTSNIPEYGDVVIWQTYKAGKPQTSGHAGIVIEVKDGEIITVEGNTNDKGGREGIEVAQKTRKLDFTNNNGLRMLGFIKPKLSY
jgi:hypothetical protein